MKDEKFYKDFDLEPSEFRKEDQPEPFWGWGAPVWWVLCAQIIVGLLIMRTASTTFDALSPEIGPSWTLAVIVGGGIAAIKLIEWVILKLAGL